MVHMLHLNERVFARAKQLAEELQVSVEEIISQAIDRFAGSASEPSKQGDIIGSFADCADLLDEVVEEAYQNRERYPLRLKSE